MVWSREGQGHTGPAPLTGRARGGDVQGRRGRRVEFPSGGDGYGYGTVQYIGCRTMENVDGVVNHSLVTLVWYSSMGTGSIP